MTLSFATGGETWRFWDRLASYRAITRRYFYTASISQPSGFKPWCRCNSRAWAGRWSARSFRSCPESRSAAAVRGRTTIRSRTSARFCSNDIWRVSRAKSCNFVTLWRCNFITLYLFIDLEIHSDRVFLTLGRKIWHKLLNIFMNANPSSKTRSTDWKSSLCFGFIWRRMLLIECVIQRAVFSANIFMSMYPAGSADAVVDERAMTSREKGVRVSDSLTVMTFQTLDTVRVDDFCLGPLEQCRGVFCKHLLLKVLVPHQLIFYKVFSQPWWKSQIEPIILKLHDRREGELCIRT